MAFRPSLGYTPSGRLSFEIVSYWHDSVRTHWIDGKSQRLEDCVGKIVVALEQAAQARRRRQEAEERARQQRAEEERRRLLKQLEREREEARRRQLTEEAERWRLAQRTRLPAHEGGGHEMRGAGAACSRTWC